MRRPRTSSRAIDDVLDDLAAGRPMDRLICGDVGFGKTEVALRAAFVAAMSRQAGGGGGADDAAGAPALQDLHASASPACRCKVGAALAPGRRPKELARDQGGLADGTIDIVVGTHALLGKAIEFKDLGLLIVDEEQHFGVAHKERLKELQADVHVLTLTATPIPRTLQLALTGVREMSHDRHAAGRPAGGAHLRHRRSTRWSIREALLRERYRGGQSFYVVPRIEDLAEHRATFLRETVPEVKVAVGARPDGRRPSSRT